MLQYRSTCFQPRCGCHSRILMPGEQSQYGISTLMTDERASQVSHSSWRTKASHNKSGLIPGPWAPASRKTKPRVPFTKASYYSREPHIATLSIKLWRDWAARRCCFSSLNSRKSKVFPLSFFPRPPAYCVSAPLLLFKKSFFSHYFHLFPPLQLQTSLSSPRPRNGVIGSGGRVKKESLLAFTSPLSFSTPAFS